MIDCEHSRRTEQPCADNREHPDRSTAEDADRIARLDLSQVCSEVTGGEDVTNEQCLIVRNAFGYPNKIDIRIRYPDFLCLHAIESAGSRRSAIEGSAFVFSKRV